MRSKRLNALLLVIAVVLDAGILFFVQGTWVRLFMGVWLLVPIIVMASYLDVAGMLGDLPTISRRERHFPLLRTKVTALLDEVRRLNWLVVDLDRGFRSRNTVEADMEMSEQRLQELLKEIQRAAGQSAEEFDEGDDTHSEDPPAMPGSEPPQTTEEG